MDKEDVNIYKHTHTHNVISLSNKKEWNNTIFSNINEPRDYHTDNITYIWKLKGKKKDFTKELIYKLTVTKGEN